MLCVCLKVVWAFPSNRWWALAQLGREARACCRLVPLPPRICMLVVWDRCEHADHKPEVSRSLCCCCRMFTLLYNRNRRLTFYCPTHRSTPIELFLQERWTLVPSGRTPKTTHHQTPPHPSINPFRLARSKTSVCTQTSTTLWTLRCSRRVSILSFWDACGTSIG